MSHSSHPLRRPAGNGALALGVSSLVTGTLVFGAGPAPANDHNGQDHANAHASAAGKGSSGGGGSSAHAGGGSAGQRSTGPENRQSQESGSQAGRGSGSENGGNQGGAGQAGAGQAGGDQDIGNQGNGSQGSSDRDAGSQGNGGQAPSSRGQQGSSHGGGGSEESASGGSDNAPDRSRGDRGKPDTTDRPGNNGTIKIDQDADDDHPNNEPHVGCAFGVDFYNYGAGSYYASVDFDAHSPTAGYDVAMSGNPRPFIGRDAPGGGTDVDYQGDYTLSFDGAPHPQQGYHVKLTIHAPYSQGADTKHKVFWVRSCDDATEDGETPGPEDQNPPPGGPGDEGEDQDGLPEDDGEDQDGLPEDDGQVTQPEAGDVPPEQSQAQPDTGTPTAPGQDGQPGEDERLTAGERPLTGAPAAGAPAPQAGVAPEARGPAATQPEAGLGAAEQAPGRRMAAAPREAAPGAEVPTQVPAGLTGSTDDGTGTGSLAGALGLSGLLAAAGAFVTSRRRRTHA